jgi:hypothetical protein
MNGLGVGDGLRRFGNVVFVAGSAASHEGNQDDKNEDNFIKICKNDWKNVHKLSTGK